ncbi:hypothetical protein [Streptomyces caelestis]|uniref:hypothetical protein n=1 Tax=Streptomyces caelestis TaxID=36816 RepID=UPI00366844DA
MPRATECPFAPPPRLRRLQTERIRRVRLGDGSTPWLVTGYEHQKRLLADPHCSVDPTKLGYPYTKLSLREAAFRKGGLPSFLNLNDPEHARIRRMVVDSFTIKRIKALRTTVQRMADDFITVMLGGPKPADLVRSLTLPLPFLVICEMLGVPCQAHEFF